MNVITFIHSGLFAARRLANSVASFVAALLISIFLFAGTAVAADMKVMNMGLGAGTVTSSPAGINCGITCDASYAAGETVTLTAAPATGTTFSGWSGDCSGTAPCVITMGVNRSVRANFSLSTAIPPLTSFTPEGIAAYLTANPTVNSTARFIKALPIEYKQNWILMSRSESLQTGTAELPRMLLPSANAQSVFSLGLAQHSSYPGSHSSAVEYMQWDATEKNFRFHEIVLDAIPALDPDLDGVGVIPARSRGVSVDDAKCSACHSTRNVLNRGTTPGTTGIPIGLVKTKNKPNWDTYDSWGGMLPFNRDRIYQGSVEAASFRKLFNFWSWRSNDAARAIIEQLELQPPGVPAAHVITRTNGGVNDGHINFAFDAAPPVLVEPTPTGSSPDITTNYSFNGAAGTGAATSVTRGGNFVTLHHSGTPTSDEGRGVQLFDLLGGADGNINPQRIADELANHRFATGSVPIDVRPIALAIAKRCLSINTASNTVTSVSPAPPLAIDLNFFNSRNGMGINDLVTDTRSRAQSLPRRKADIQKLDLDRTGDTYLVSASNGLIQQYGAATAAGTDTSMSRLRQEVFRRFIDAGGADSTVMGGIYVDRELYAFNTSRMALYRYFLEPLGVSVDKWSMGVRGRSRTYTFADVFGTYENVFQPQLEASLSSDPVSGLSSPYSCTDLIAAVNTTLSSAVLPPADGAGAIPTYTDVQRIFNKSCIECHGGLDYPPYNNYGSFLDLSEDESPAAGAARLDRSHAVALAVTTNDPATSFLYDKITRTSEDCPFGVMPCGGPALSKTDVETIRRWIVGARPNTAGDPHLTTIDGTHYDFQSAGEFVLLRGENLEIQARQTAVSTDGPLSPNAHTGLSSCVSVNSAVAIRVGKQRITYQPNLNGEPDPEGLQLRIDGKLTTMTANSIPLASGGRIIKTTAPGGIQIEAPGGSVVVVTPGWWNHYQLWYMNIDARSVRATQGVMGVIAPRNWLPALPDGSFLGPRPKDLHQRYIDLYDKFANAWRVDNASTLFDYAPGTSTQTFTIASWPEESPQSCVVPQAEGTPAKPPVQALPLAEAEQHCHALIDVDRKDNCVKDVMATGEPGFAKTYLLTEQIENNKLPSAPELGFPEDNQTDLVIPVKFTWNRAIDFDGDTITYKHCVWPAGEGVDNNECVDVATTTNIAGIPCKWLVLLIGCLLFILLLILGMKKKPGLLILVAIVILVSVLLAQYLCGSGTISRTVTELESGKAYYWKIIAEDGKGGTVESRTRRFETK
jgi:hypothetical protein